MFREAVKHLKNVEVKSFTGLVVDFARKQRGKGPRPRHPRRHRLRSRAGHGADEQEDGAGDRVRVPDGQPGAPVHQRHRIREVASLGYDVGELVPAHVIAALEKKFGKKP